MSRLAWVAGWRLHCSSLLFQNPKKEINKTFRMVSTGWAISEGRASFWCRGLFMQSYGPRLPGELFYTGHTKIRSPFFLLYHSPFPAIITMSVCLKSSLTGIWGPHYRIARVLGAGGAIKHSSMTSCKKKKQWSKGGKKWHPDSITFSRIIITPPFCFYCM